MIQFTRKKDNPAFGWRMDEGGQAWKPEEILQGRRAEMLGCPEPVDGSLEARDHATSIFVSLALLTTQPGAQPERLLGG